MQKKAYIITFYDEINYGAALQAYAVQSVLKAKGYLPEFLGVSLASFKKEEKSISPLNLVFKFINKKKVDSFKNFRKQEFSVFCDGTTYDELIKKNPECDLLVCGSDQIWNPLITNGFQPFYFGKGIKAKTKISYAASCGKFDLLENDFQAFKDIASELKAISVREKTTSDFLNNKGITNCVVSDPTLLLPQKEWAELSEKSKLDSATIAGDYIFVYDLDPTEQFTSLVNKVSEETGMKVVSLRNKSHYLNNDIRFPDASPYDFLKLINNASMVISNSYHAMLFSSIFKKQCYIVSHSKYSERMVDFLKLFDVEFENNIANVDFSRKDSLQLSSMIEASHSFIDNCIEDFNE
ncbi:MAG: polysaccharide pyruvyl transferase family protein [Clostridia bacterium]|nr:polysaccharide pyruvyl transferase family protein [Clostridia bacterium]